MARGQRQGEHQKPRASLNQARGFPLSGRRRLFFSGGTAIPRDRLNSMAAATGRGPFRLSPEDEAAGRRHFCQHCGRSSLFDRCWRGRRWCILPAKPPLAARWSAVSQFDIPATIRPDPAKHSRYMSGAHSNPANRLVHLKPRPHRRGFSSSWDGRWIGLFDATEPDLQAGSSRRGLTDTRGGSNHVPSPAHPPWWRGFLWSNGHASMAGTANQMRDSTPDAWLADSHQ